MYKLIFSKKSLDFLNKLENELKDRIWNKLQLCKENLFRFMEHLEQIKGFKLRVGDHRVIIDVDSKYNVLHIVKIGHRKKIYEK
ncbi:MAG: type II toxin-antitoxin system RelE/ParE family toxin [Nanoarchaeota archaeon]|nr:type II toxin-antitoxin system RelE/ParE family toxin [Nanoarchaeota archaeon]